MAGCRAPRRQELGLETELRVPAERSKARARAARPAAEREQCEAERAARLGAAAGTIAREAKVEKIAPPRVGELRSTSTRAAAAVAAASVTTTTSQPEYDARFGAHYRPRSHRARRRHAQVIVTIYAAHVVSWSTAAGEQLFVSSAAEYGGGKAVRGGIPICWPQFAARGPGGKHGFCRNSAKWTVVRTSEAPFPCVVFGLADDEATKADYPHSFSLRYS